MAILTGGQAVVETLRRLGIDTLFGIPGVHTGGLYDALLDAPDIRHIITRHEQGAAGMADGFARASGRLACLSTITGPGVTNAATALAEAYADSSPLLHIATRVDSSAAGVERGELHELRDQSGVLRSVVRHHDAVQAVAEVPGALIRAARAAVATRPGPASVEIPVALLTATADLTIPAVAAPQRPRPDPAAIERAARLLAEADRPVILVGGGGIDAGPELAALAERLSAPVLTFHSGKGAIPESHPLALGCPARAEPTLVQFLGSRDVGLVVGCRLGPVLARPERVALPARLIQIDTDPSVIGANFPVEAGIQGDAAAVLLELYEAVPAAASPDGGARSEVAGVREQRATAAEYPPAPAILAALREAMPPDAVLANDMTRVSYEAPAFFSVDRPRSFLYPVYYGTLGFSFPAALGAQVACPDRPVVSLSGDGGFLFSSEELATAVRERLPVIAVVLNDGLYGAIDAYHRHQFNGRSPDVRLANPDFAALARAYGLTGVQVRRPPELREAVRAALGRREPSVVEYVIE